MDTPSKPAATPRHLDASDIARMRSEMLNSFAPTTDLSELHRPDEREDRPRGQLTPSDYL